MSSNENGKLGETLARDYLIENNFSIIDKNYFSRFGEIDIIALDKFNLDIVFIEVKTRKNSLFGRPSEYVNTKKQLRIKKTALDFISKKKVLDKNFRFDIIEVIFAKKIINHIKNAFEF